ncbi:hypothetical protein G4B88_017218 [Cannabis sativa]|uniref:Bifunctional inhibitor/plant lipid transfer protein/seed storage helical domain-containing protein n=1 Tax=Cannabis sativa TaxID=3483 RepID=A0A7J6G131_CANSA|nr:hypothetical protein G4B88_017218 [Cannabis sativa]
MEGLKTFQSIAYIILILICLVNGQISTPCTFTMITSFTPCLNFITGSSSNGQSQAPTTGCCSSLRTLLSSGMDCACLLVTASVPFQLPINRTLALSLPSACNMNGVPIQCKSSGTPLPASADSPTSLVSKVTSTDPESEDMSPAASPVTGSEGPTKLNPGIRPVLGPSSSAPTLTHLIPSSLPHNIIATMIYLILF